MTNKEFFEFLRKCFSNALTDREATLNNAIINRINDVEKKLESIDEANFSEALKCLEDISNEEVLFRSILSRSTVYMGGEKIDDFSYKSTIGNKFKGAIPIIKQALIQAEKNKKSNEENNKNLDIIIKKDVDLRSLKASFNTPSGLSEYNRHQREENELSSEEYNALKNMYNN